MSESDWNALTHDLVTTYLAVVRCDLHSDDEKQRGGLALVAWDMGEFARGALGLVVAKNHSAAYALVRPIVERAHTLAAIHHDRAFAHRFWAASASFETLGQRERGPKDARGHFRRFIESQIGREPSLGILRNQIEMVSSAGLAVHPSALIPALTRRAASDDSDAVTIASSITTASTLALFVLILVAEARNDTCDLRTARALVRNSIDRCRDLLAADVDDIPSGGRNSV